MVEILLRNRRRIHAADEDIELDDIDGLTSSLLNRLCDSFVSCMPAIKDRILRNVENPNDLQKEFTYDIAIFREYFHDKFFSSIRYEISGMKKYTRRLGSYLIRAYLNEDSSINVEVGAYSEGITPIYDIFEYCSMHDTKFFISIIEEECFKYTVVLPDASVETFCISRNGGGKSVTVRDNNTFVYKELLTDAEDIIVFSRCTKTPVLNVSVTSLEEIKPQPE